MSKDGPAISGGRRFGGIKAMRAGLPPKATNPRSLTTADLRAGQTLADFAAYPQRAKSIGKSVPKTLGISEGRAAARQKIQELDQLSNERTVTLLGGGRIKLDLVFNTISKSFHFVEENFATGIIRRSVSYSSRKRAMHVFYSGSTTWIEP